MSTPEASIDKLNYIIANYDDDLAAKADKEGSYPNLVAGNLYSTSGKTDVTPYLFRETNADRLDLKAVTGGTVAWNQLAEVFNANYWGFLNATKSGSDSLTVLTSAANGQFGLYQASGHRPAIAGHKYYLSGYVTASNGGNITFGIQNKTLVKSVESNVKTKIEAISEGVAQPFVCYRNSSTAGDTLALENFQMFDLTLAFGSTIADYIYTLEQNNAGAGVAWFKKLFPKPYYAYDAGSLQSVNASAHITRGFNQWDEEWEVGTISASTGQDSSSSSKIRSKNYVAVVPEQTYYYLSTQGTTIYYYDQSKAFMGTASVSGNHTFSVPSGCRYLRFSPNSSYGTTYNHDICINISKPTGTPKNGDYVPYEVHTYALDSSLTLRGIPKLDANNNLYYDGDTYESDGKVTRKYGVVDLGTLTWTYYTSGTYPFFYADISNGKQFEETNLNINAICSKYTVMATSQSGGNFGADASTRMAVNGRTGITGTRWLVRDGNYSDAATFKTAMSGVYLVYELATPTEETAEGYTKSQVAAIGGTEQFVDYAESQGTRDVAIPVGNEEFFMTPLKEPLEDIVNSVPSSDGTYTLKASVSGGVVTYSWV